MLKKERGILSSAASGSSGEKMKDIEAEGEKVEEEREEKEL